MPPQLPPPPYPAQQAPASAKTFSQYAENKMWELFKHHDDQVGNRYPGDHQGKSVTDCTIYVCQTLEYAFEQMGQTDRSRVIHGFRTKSGRDMALYLVSIGWNAYYWNPDVKNPRDGDQEHPFAYQQALKNKHYKNVPVEDKMIVNYNLTSHGRRQNDMDAFNKLSRVRFAYVLARGATHNFLLSYGMVFEVHWDKIGDGLYERSPFYTFEWLDGVVVVPPDAGFSL